jgi:hypothetical protein
MVSVRIGAIFRLSSSFTLTMMLKHSVWHVEQSSPEHGPARRLF